MQKTDPPPYGEPNGAAEEVEDGDSHSDKIFVPPRIMKKVMALKTHKERILMTEEYIVKRGKAVEKKEKELFRQKRALAQTINDANNDIRNLERTYWKTVGNILDVKKHPIRSFFSMVSRDYGWDRVACESLVAARKDEARRLHKIETEKIDAAFQKALKRVDEEYNILLGAMLASNKQAAKAEV